MWKKCGIWEDVNSPCLASQCYITFELDIDAQLLPLACLGRVEE